MAENEFKKTLQSRGREKTIFIPKELQEKVLSIIDKKFKGCLQEKFDRVNDSKTADKALENAVKEISLLIEMDLMSMYGKSYNKNYLLFKDKKNKRDIKEDVRSELKDKSTSWPSDKMSAETKRHYSNLTLGSTNSMNKLFGDNIKDALNAVGEIVFSLSKNISEKRKEEELLKKLG